MIQQARPRTLRVVRSTESPPQAVESDDALLAAFARGDVEFGERLYVYLVGVVDATLYRILGQRGSDHEDLVQSAFEQIVLTLSNGAFARACSLRSWAAAITGNLAFNTVRSRATERKVINRQACPDAVEGARFHGDPERDSAARHSLSMLRDLLSQMSPKLAHTLILHDAFGHELSEIAVLTGVSIAAAQSRLVRGRRTLEQLIANSGIREES